MSVLAAVIGDSACRARNATPKTRFAPVIEVSIGFAALFALILLRLPIGFAMALARLPRHRPYDRLGAPPFAGAADHLRPTGLAYELSVVPLFVLMGNLVARAGLSKGALIPRRTPDARAPGRRTWRWRPLSPPAVQRALHGIPAWTTVRKTSPTSGQGGDAVKMRRFGYADSLAAGSIAAGLHIGESSSRRASSWCSTAS